MCDNNVRQGLKPTHEERAVGSLVIMNKLIRSDAVMVLDTFCCEQTQVTQLQYQLHQMKVKVHGP